MRNTRKRIPYISENTVLMDNILYWGKAVYKLNGEFGLRGKAPFIIVDWFSSSCDASKGASTIIVPRNDRRAWRHATR